MPACPNRDSGSFLSPDYDVFFLNTVFMRKPPFALTMVASGEDARNLIL
jgi:hypothetical protein